MTQEQKEDYVDFLQCTLLKKIKNNPQFSLRAFAKMLEVNYAHLSLVLRKVRPLTAKFIKKTGTHLDLEPHEIAHFIIKTQKNKKGQYCKNIENSRLQHISVEQFSFINEWYFDALMELSKTSEFREDFQWMSQRLGISYHQAKAAFSSLVDMKFIEKKEGQYQSLDTSTNITNESTSADLKKYQKTILEKSLNALEEYPRTIRDHTSLTLAISKQDLNKAKNIIEKFRINLMEELQDLDCELDEVYQLSVSFFPVTNIYNN